MSSMMMGSNRDRDDALTFTNPSSSSAPITFSDQLDSYLTEPSSLIGSASGSLQNDSQLGGGDGGIIHNDAEFGFSRPDFRQSPLAGTVEFYERHIFLCYKNPRVWPPRIEAAEFDRLPRLLYAAVMARTNDMKKRVFYFYELRFDCEMLARKKSILKSQDWDFFDVDYMYYISLSWS